MKKLLLLTIALYIFSNENISAQLSATTNSTNPSCANNNGTATITASGGNFYTYKWSNGATTATADSLAAGTYTVTVYSSGTTIWDTLYLETFNGIHNWTLNVSTGANDPDHNFWQVTDDEGGVAPTGCGAASNGDATLHVTSVVNPTGGAAYDAGSQGLCSQLPGIIFCTTTNQAANSPNLNTTGATNLVLQYDFIGGGQNTVDVGSSQYSINGGTNYTSLDASLRSINTGCGGQGKWTQRSYNLPTNCVGLNNFKVGFNWMNNDDAAGTDPSIAINNVLLRDSLPGTADSIVKTITLTLPSPPHFVTAALSVVNPSCGSNNGSINNVGVVGGTPNYVYSWTVSGAQIGTANSLTNVGVGTYTFEATDQNSCTIDTSFTLMHSGMANETISTNDSMICASDSTTICTQQTFSTYLWSTGATTSCITVHTAGNYYVTVSDGSNCTATSNHLPIYVYPLPPVSISVNGDTLTAHNGATYQWFKDGTIIGGALNAVFIATQTGVYSVEVTDTNGCYATSNGVTVLVSGMNEIGKEEFQFQLFPNPTDGDLNIVVNEILIGEEIFSTDLQGRILLKEKITASTFQLYTSKFSKGIYLVRMKNVVKKFVKE